MPASSIQVGQQPPTPTLPTRWVGTCVGEAYASSSSIWAPTPVRALGKLQPCAQLSQAPIPAKLLSLGVSCPYAGKEKYPVSMID